MGAFKALATDLAGFLASEDSEKIHKGYVHLLIVESATRKLKKLASNETEKREDLLATAKAHACVKHEAETGQLQVKMKNLLDGNPTFKD